MAKLLSLIFLMVALIVLDTHVATSDTQERLPHFEIVHPRPETSVCEPVFEAWRENFGNPLVKESNSTIDCNSDQVCPPRRCALQLSQMIGRSTTSCQTIPQ